MKFSKPLQEYLNEHNEIHYEWNYGTWVDALSQRTGYDSPQIIPNYYSLFWTEKQTLFSAAALSASRIE